MLLLYSLLILVPFAPSLASAHSDLTARLVGRVVAAKSGAPLAHAQVFIAALNRGDVTDAHGRFEIERLPAGTYRLHVRLQGYEHVATEVVLRAETTVEVTVEMTPAILVLDDVVVTATRGMALAHEVPQMVNVLDARDLRHKSLPQAPEMLRQAAGVVVQKTSQGGGSPIVRGLKANKLLFLVDGIRLNNATYRGGNIQYLNTVDSELLERIEVVHGPSSVLYGSDALGGTINVVTRSPSFRTGQGSVFTGAWRGGFATADGTRFTGLSLDVSQRRWAASFTGSFKSFGDVTRGGNGGATLMRRLANDSRTQRVLRKTQAPNGYDAYAFGVKLRVKLGDSGEVVAAYQLDRQLGVPRYDVVEVRQDSIRKFDPQERDLLYLRYRRSGQNTWFNRVEVTLSLHRQFERRIRQKFGSVTRTTDDIRTISPGLQLQFDKVVGRHHFTYGTELYLDQVATQSSARNTTTGARSRRAPVFPDGSTFLSFGLFLQDAVELGTRWRLYAGGRFSAFRLRAPFAAQPGEPFDFGVVVQNNTALTGSLGMQYHLTEHLSLVGNLAQGFRTPNLDDVSKVGVGKGSRLFDVPNPEARPEKSLSVDAGVKLSGARLQLNLVGFYSHLSDLLIRQPTTVNGQTFVVEEGDTLLLVHRANVARASTAGFALDVQAEISDHWLAGGNLSYTYGENRTDSEPLTGIPPLTGRVELRWQRPSAWAEVSARFAASQTRLSSEDKQDLRIPEGGTPGWWSLDLQAGVQVAGPVTLKAYVTNLLDRNYREHLSGFNAPGRNFGLTAEWRF